MLYSQIAQPSRRNVLKLSAGAVLAAAAAKPGDAFAQMNKGMITAVVGFPPGGAPDLVARVIAAMLRERIGRTVIVENRPGANGLLAMQAVKNASGSNTMLIVGPIEMVTLSPHVKRVLPYNTMKDFAPVASISSNAYGLAVGPLAPVKTIPELVAWCKAHPQQATYGTSGIGTPHHLLGMIFARAAGIEFTNISYRGGTDVLKDVQGGSVASLIAALPLLVTRQRSGSLDVIATTGSERNKALPDVPTFAEVGYPAMTSSGVMGIFTSRATPASEVELIAEAMNNITRSPEFTAAAEKFGQDPNPLSRADFSALLQREYERWKGVVQETGFHPED